MNHIQKLVAQRLAAGIVSEEAGMRICQAIGDREGERRHERNANALRAEVWAQIEMLERQGGCFFDLAGMFCRMQAEAGRIA